MFIHFGYDLLPTRGSRNGDDSNLCLRPIVRGRRVRILEVIHLRSIDLSSQHIRSSATTDLSVEFIHKCVFFGMIYLKYRRRDTQQSTSCWKYQNKYLF